MSETTRPRDKRRRLLARWTWISIGATVLVTIVVVMLARPTIEVVPAAGSSVEGLTSVLARSIDPATVNIRFEDMTTRAGLEFKHLPVARASLLPEDMGSGVACGDYDGDGFTDVYLVNFAGNTLPEAPLDTEQGRCRLYRNIAGERFEDVTDTAGVGLVTYGMGAAWGDFDNDGDLDLYVTAFGPNVLYRNQGDGTFVDVTSASRTADERFSAGASWADVDRDGHLDLYVCNYVDFTYRDEDHKGRERQYSTEQPYTLNPSSYPPQANALFRNRGDGTFEEISEKSGVADPRGRSLSASWVDLNNDGWVDLYVANDVSNNAVLVNRSAQGTVAFEDVGAASLAADYRGAMGIAVGDFDQDHDQDLMITHWIAQENALYRNMTHDADVGNEPSGWLWFMDHAENVGLGQVSLDMVGWATGFCDFDNDGRPDLWILNGSTIEQPRDHTQLKKQPSFLFWNQGAEGFVDVAAHASDVLARRTVRRGGAHIDVDGDGRVDLIMVDHGGAATFLRNISPNPGHWLRVLLTQEGGNTSALGARVYLTVAGQTQMMESGASSSYLSQDEPYLHFGLGAAEVVDSLRIVWPDGFEETRTDLPADQIVRITHVAAYD